MLNFLIRRPVAVIMSFLGALTLGLLVGRGLPVGLLPEVPIPRISVQLEYPNTSARELENTVVRPLRNQLLQVGNLKDLSSRTRNNSAVISLEFDFGTDTDLAFIEVNEKIDQVMGQLPREMERPRVLKANVADIPVLYLSLIPQQLDSLRGPARTEALLELSDFARSVVKRRLEQLRQVAFVDISGFAEPQITIVPKRDVWESLNFTEEKLEQVVRENNLDLGSILVQDGQYQYNLRFRSALRSREDIADIYLRHGGRLLQLRELAEVRRGIREQRGQYLFDGQPALVFTVRKQADAQLFALKREMEVLLADFLNQYPELDFRVTNDQSELLEVSIDNLLSSLGYGALFAFLVLFIFFREWRAPILIGIAVPLALVVALLGFYLIDLSINTISLAGLILGVGLMIDNSIIVIENIRQQRRMGYGLTEACVRGGNEVIRPLISSALTTCSVFLPLIFLSGIAGALFYDQAVSITIALGASLLVAYLLLPTLLRLIARRGEGPAVDPTQSYRRYTRSVDGVLRVRWLTLLVFLGIIGAGLWLVDRVPQERFPELSRPALRLSVDWNEAIDLNENRRRVRALLDDFSTDLRISNSFVGEQQFLLASEKQSLNEAELVLYGRKIDLTKLETELEGYLRQTYPTATFDARPLENIFDQVFGQEGAPLIVHLQSAVRQETPPPEAALPLIDFWAQWGLRADLPPQQEQYYLNIRREEALRYGVPYDRIRNRLRTLFNRQEVGILRETNRRAPIRLGVDRPSFYDLINEATVTSSEGDRLPLRYFVRLERREDYKQLTAGRAGESLRLPLDRYEAGIVESTRDWLRANGRLTAFFSGQFFENRQVLRELAVIMAVSILLLYLILAAQFESLVQPLIVIFTVPVGLTGALFALWLAGQSLNLVAIIGMIVMSGIVVNDAILKVDMMNRLGREHPLREAIHGAGVRRLRPILMTSMTTILALLPVLFSEGLGAELQRPLAWAVVGGLVMGTVSSLYFIPVLYGMRFKKI